MLAGLYCVAVELDIDTARAAFDASTDFTVGLEEEFAVLDPDSLELAGRFEQLRDAAADDPLLADAIAGELISSEIEIRSGRGEDLGCRPVRPARAAPPAVRAGGRPGHGARRHRDPSVV